MTTEFDSLVNPYASGKSVPDSAWKPHCRHQQAGYVFEEIPGVAIFLSPLHESATREMIIRCIPPTIPVTSVEIKILSADKGMCLSETVFPSADDPASYPDVLAAAKRFSLLHAANYFQDRAKKCLELYNKDIAG